MHWVKAGNLLIRVKLIHFFQSGLPSIYIIVWPSLIPNVVAHRKPRWWRSNSLIRPKNMGTRVWFRYSVYYASIQRYAYTRVLMEKRFLSVRTHEIEIETLRHCVSCRKFKSLIDRSARAHLLAISGFRGGGYFASLRARASSREPRASVCEPQKIPAKKSKNGHNALIWHLLHAEYFIYANTRGTFYQNRANQRESDSNNFNSFSEFLT